MKERDAIKIGESCGLEFVDSYLTSTHRCLRFRRPNDADLLRITTSINGAGLSRDEMNLRGQMRRFARGQVHGLLIEKANT